MKYKPLKRGMFRFLSRLGGGAPQTEKLPPKHPSSTYCRNLLDWALFSILCVYTDTPTLYIIVWVTRPKLVVTTYTFVERWVALPTVKLSPVHRDLCSNFLSR